VCIEYEQLEEFQRHVTANCGSKFKKTRQALYYVVTLRRVRATNVAVAKQYVLHILSICVCFV